jgi:hypothetical protein
MLASFLRVKDPPTPYRNGNYARKSGYDGRKWNTSYC